MNQLTSPAELKIERQLHDLDASHSIVAAGDVTGHVGDKRHPGWLRLAASGAAIGLVLGLSNFGWRYWTIGRFEVSTDDAYIKADSTIIAPKCLSGEFLNHMNHL